MKLLLYSWDANNEKILADNLIKLGFEVVWFRKACKHYTRDMELAMEMIPLIHAQKVEAVISFNYFPIVSMICSTCQIPYYAWVYDCPHFTLYAKQLMLPCNHIGIFDQAMVRNLETYGVGDEVVRHVPLAVDCAYFDGAIRRASTAERKRYLCDISFVGSLYTDEYNYYDRLFRAESMEADAKNVAAAAIEDGVRRQCFSYRQDYLKQAVAEGSIDLHMLRTQMEEQGLMLGEDYFARAEDILLAAVLEKKVTVEERKTLLQHIAEEIASGTGGNYTFRLYTGSATEDMEKLHPFNCGRVDYHTQMPLVFAGSKINLNISLRSIHSGIPLRVLDIMACGGFVLSNWQPEIAEYFTEGVDIVTFDGPEDCLAKTAYYLEHEEKRRQIAASGREKVRKAFSYQAGLEALFSSSSIFASAIGKSPQLR